MEFFLALFFSSLTVAIGRGFFIESRRQPEEFLILGGRGESFQGFSIGNTGLSQTLVMLK